MCEKSYKSHRQFSRLVKPTGQALVKVQVCSGLRECADLTLRVLTGGQLDLYNTARNNLFKLGAFNDKVLALVWLRQELRGGLSGSA